MCALVQTSSLDKTSCYYRSLSPARLRASSNTAAAGESTTTSSASASVAAANATNNDACPSTATNQLNVNSNWLKVPTVS